LATKKSWRVNAPVMSRPLLDAFLEEVALVAGREMDTARLGLRLSPSDFDDFRNRLQKLLDEVARLPEDPSAPAWSLFLAMHPDPNRP
ncbi:MAG: hypothetical protein QOE53_983, partial [Pseudonocardiales bacterium]|nr:hypothetical protein [Pseudonocardiales bacterium]